MKELSFVWFTLCVLGKFAFMPGYRPDHEACAHPER